MELKLQLHIPPCKDSLGIYLHLILTKVSRRYHSYKAKKASLGHGHESSPSRNKASSSTVILGVSILTVIVLQSSDSKEESKATNELLEGETATERE